MGFGFFFLKIIFSVLFFKLVHYWGTVGLVVFRLQENLVCHPSLNYEQGGRDKRFFEKLSLEHFNKMLDTVVLRLLGLGNFLVFD